jgi:hypothetical protein
LKEQNFLPTLLLQIIEYGTGNHFINKATIRMLITHLLSDSILSNVNIKEIFFYNNTISTFIIPKKAQYLTRTFVAVWLRGVLLALLYYNKKHDVFPRKFLGQCTVLPQMSWDIW